MESTPRYPQQPTSFEMSTGRAELSALLLSRRPVRTVFHSHSHPEVLVEYLDVLQVPRVDISRGGLKGRIDRRLLPRPG